ncbi:MULTISPECIES: flagellar protein FilC [Marinobacter]|uniref:Flagellar protein FilC n=1 Tax=Marinobacter profundi TaxID=2666256 RepID=A0A2G1UPE3_9GAMM|nr:MULTISPECIES: flagellar protein FilC [Marinobacter]MBD3656355.1 transporter [Marinobacter sp.]PHQ16342.1 flagellar protein FilC [Marinobacter profundi]
MNRWFVRGFVLYSVVGLVPAMAVAQDSSVDQAREALAKQEGDEDSSRQLEEVFQAAEKNYSLQRKGTHALTYSFDYSYTGDQRLDLAITDGSVRNLDVVPSATHNFTNAFSYDFGLLDNLTVGTRVPLVVKYDTQDELSIYDLGDVSFTARWQPFAYVPGKISTTVFSTLTSKTGVSPYEIDINEQLSTGSGYYSVSGGLSLSKVLDPVVVFGSVSATYNLPEEDLQQVRGARLLTEVEPGFGLSGSGGFAYSLSYDISMSISVQLSYSDETSLTFSDGSEAVAQDQMTGFLSMSLGTRVSDTTIVNTSLGIGLTEDAPDFSLGVSLPINFSGLKD